MPLSFFSFSFYPPFYIVLSRSHKFLVVSPGPSGGLLLPVRPPSLAALSSLASPLSPDSPALRPPRLERFTRSLVPSSTVCCWPLCYRLALFFCRRLDGCGNWDGWTAQKIFSGYNNPSITTTTIPILDSRMRF